MEPTNKEGSVEAGGIISLNHKRDASPAKEQNLVQCKVNRTVGNFLEVRIEDKLDENRDHTHRVKQIHDPKPSLTCKYSSDHKSYLHSKEDCVALVHCSFLCPGIILLRF